MLRWWCERPRYLKEQEWLYISSNVNTYRKEFSVRFPRRYTQSLISKVPISSHLTNLLFSNLSNSWKIPGNLLVPLFSVICLAYLLVFSSPEMMVLLLSLLYYCVSKEVILHLVGLH